MFLSILLLFAAIAGIVYGTRQKNEKWIVGSTVLLVAILLFYVYIYFYFMQTSF
ncbi:hypothetical protein [Planococcus beijingensis]|uniref:hypothetical protein n=1 Tax=Planococcus beijingensis TaxID=2782551 RepID=UPI00193C1E1A|nr:hypothetical protein [Planococcus beijingensis]